MKWKVKLPFFYISSGFINGVPSYHLYSWIWLNKAMWFLHPLSKMDNSFLIVLQDDNLKRDGFLSCFITIWVLLKMWVKRQDGWLMDCFLWLKNLPFQWIIFLRWQCWATSPEPFGLKWAFQVFCLPSHEGLEIILWMPLDLSSFQRILKNESRWQNSMQWNILKELPCKVWQGLVQGVTKSGTRCDKVW